MLAKDVMTMNVVTVEPGAAVRDIATLLLERNISAMPVVGPDGSILGIVSEGDLMRRSAAESDKRMRPWWLRLVAGSGESAGDYVKSHGRHAGDVMTRNVVVVEEDTPVTEIARTLEEKHIKRVPVVRDGKLVGIVSRANLLRGLATHKEASPPALSESDQAIRKELHDRLRAEPWAKLNLLNVTVTDGVVHMWGLVQSADQPKALRIMAEAVPGVKAVEDHVQVMSRILV